MNDTIEALEQLIMEDGMSEEERMLADIDREAEKLAQREWMENEEERIFARQNRRRTQLKQLFRG